MRVMTLNVRDIDWDQALCGSYGKEADRFHVDQWKGEGKKEKVKATERAKELCKTPCPILEQCLVYAYQHKLQGVHGATTTAERKELRKKRMELLGHE